MSEEHFFEVGSYLSKISKAKVCTRVASSTQCPNFRVCLHQKSRDTIRELQSKVISCGVNVSTSSSVKYSSLGDKELCKMTCYMKYIFVWIFLIPQRTGYVFIWDFVPIFSVFTFYFPIRTRLIHLMMYKYLGDFYIDSSRLGCLLNCIRCFNSKS